MPHKIVFTTKLNDLKNQYAIYKLHEIGSMEVLFIGFCQMDRLFQLVEPSKHPSFNRNALYLCDVVEICTNKIDAIVNTRNMMPKNAPLPQFNRYDQRGRGKIVCDQTGDIFKSIQETARLHCIDPGALSNHLNRKPGFKSVKKRTYFYLTM